MKYILPVLVFLGICINTAGQAVEGSLEGSVSYITTQSVYVKFTSTTDIQAGDTLYMIKEGLPVPALIVTGKSSISCVCVPINGFTAGISDKIFTKPKKIPPPEVIRPPVDTAAVFTEPVADTVARTEDEPKQKKQDISGRISLSSYSNFSSTPAGNSQRMRYTFSINAKNIANTALSAESYISFVHRSGEWDEIRENIFNGLKIYSLAFRYDFKSHAMLLLGRKINPKLSSIGAIDGLQFEKKFKSVSFGLIAGSRPDYQDYSYNSSLMQFGGYVSHEWNKGKGSMQSTLAFVDQENSWNTDRRFLYLQHNNTLLKNLYFFGSVEFDLYQKVAEQKDNTFNLTNFYVLLRYKVIKQLSLSLSYSARNNIIYYETYKDIVERLLENSTLQGLIFQVQYRPIPKLSIGAKAGYRARQEDPRPSRNVDGYVTYSQVPVLNVSATVSATWLETSYITGRIFTAGISRDIIQGKLYCGLNYRYVDYQFYSNETSIAQNLAEVSLNWNIYKKLLLSVNYEGTFEKQYNYTRLYINLTQRF